MNHPPTFCIIISVISRHLSTLFWPFFYPYFLHSSAFFLRSCVCWLMTYFLILTFAIGQKNAHIYSVGPSCHICMHIYDDTIYKRCYPIPFKSNVFQDYAVCPFSKTFLALVVWRWSVHLSMLSRSSYLPFYLSTMRIYMLFLKHECIFWG